MTIFRPDNDNNKLRVQQQFGKSAAAYAISDVHASGESLELFRHWIEPESHWRVLDVATGAGHAALLFAPQVAEVVASDLTDEMLREMAQAARARGLDNIRAYQADAESLPFDDGHFDLVSCRLAFHHFVGQREAAREFARVLRPGGILAFTDNITVDDQPAADYYNRYEKLRDPSHHRVMSSGQLESCLKLSGFEINNAKILSKEFEFQEWANRQHVSDDDKQRLLEMMRQIPQALEPLLRPCWADGTMYFSLWEYVIVATRL